MPRPIAVLDHVHVVLTLDGTAQQLTLGAAGGTRIRDLSLQPGAANTHPVFVGGDDTVDTTSYGVRLPPPVTGEPPPPFIRDGFEDGALTLENFWVVGEPGDTLHVDVLVYQ